MGDEVERKFLIWENDVSFATPIFFDLYPSIEQAQRVILAEGVKIDQGYLPLERGKTLAHVIGMTYDFEPVEARLRKMGTVAYYLTIKGDGTVKRVEKKRQEKPYQRFHPETDVYTDRDLIVLEVEAPNLEIAATIPVFGKEITTDKRYKNKNLAK